MALSKSFPSVPAVAIINHEAPASGREWGRLETRGCGKLDLYELPGILLPLLPSLMINDATATSHRSESISNGQRGQVTQRGCVGVWVCLWVWV